MSAGTTTIPVASPSIVGADAAFRSRSTQTSLVNRRDLTPPERQVLEQHAFDFACVPESYDIAISDGHLLRSPCGSGMASVLADRNFWHMAGGLLAPQESKPEMIRWLYSVSTEQRKTIAVYNVSKTDAVKFRDAGFVVNKFGEEPVLNPRDMTWSGKPFEWVRRQANFCVRSGIEISEITDSQQQVAIGATLVDIMEEDLAGRTFDKPLRLLEGEFDPHSLLRRRLFVAHDREGRVEAFLACSPIDGGRSWAFETYRKRKNATRGVTAYLFKTVIDTLRDEDVEQVSLCLVPGRNVRESPLGNDDWKIEKVLSLWYSQLDFIFNAKGQDHFKSRFRPRYTDRYLCVAPANSVASLWSFLKTTGATQCNWRNLSRHFRSSLFQR